MFLTILLYTVYFMGALIVIQFSIPLIGYIIYGTYVALASSIGWVAKKARRLFGEPKMTILDSYEIYETTN